MIGSTNTGMWVAIGIFVVCLTGMIAMNDKTALLFSNGLQQLTRRKKKPSTDTYTYASLKGNIYSYEGAIKERKGATIRLESSGKLHEGLYIDGAAIVMDKLNEVSFDIQKISGVVTSIGGRMPTSMEVSVSMDGKELSTSWTDAEHNLYPNDCHVHHIVIRFVPVSDTYVSLLGNHLYIQPNRQEDIDLKDVAPYNLRIRNIRVKSLNNKIEVK